MRRQDRQKLMHSPDAGRIEGAERKIAIAALKGVGMPPPDWEDVYCGYQRRRPLTDDELASLDPALCGLPTHVHEIYGQMVLE